jgi:enoyl-CoA hydratase/carnithine racemase
MHTGDVRTEAVNGIGWIILDRPMVRNAVRPQTMQEICEATDRFTADPAIAGIGLMGNGDHFLAGADFEFLEETAAGSSMNAYDKIYTHFQGAARRLFRCQKPTVAAISGAAITVGCELSLTCDVRVADETAFFDESWLRLGLIPPLGGAMLLPRVIGLARAKEMILEGRRINAAEALRIGLISELCAKGDLRERAQARIEAMAAVPAAAFRVAKEAIHRGLESAMESEWQATVLAQGILLGSDEFRHRVAGLRRPRLHP